jgi:hypothetical protein
MKMNQKSAVFAAISMVLSAAGIEFNEGENVAEHMTKERRAEVNAILFQGFRAGDIELDREYSDTDLKAYVSGLQSNWIRKDKRLNGNTIYVAKNPGSRAGSGDSQLKNMKLLLATLTPGTPDYIEVEQCIAVRTTEVATAKAKTVTVDFSALPAHLRAKFQK